MSRFFRGAALFVGLTVLIWVAVLWRWQSTHREMTVTDIVAYLGLLPVIVFALLLGLRWAWRGAQPRREAALRVAAAQQASPPAGAAALAPGREAQERQAATLLLGAYVACAAGTTAAELLAAAASGEPRPGLDDALRDGDGLPVFSARMGHLASQPLATQLESMAAAQRAERADWAAAEIGEPTVRALAALAEPLLDALQQIAADLAEPGPVRGGQPPAATARPDAALPLVRVLLGLPVTWTEFEQAAALGWLRAQVAMQGALPLERFVFAAHAGSGEALWQQADALLLSLAREGRNDLVLLAACHSDVADAAIERLEREGRLFSAQRRPKGAMPGEAAAVLLLAGAGWPAGPDVGAEPAKLHRAAIAQRDKAIEASGGRVGHQILDEVTSHALVAGNLDGAALTSIVCDADQHTARGAELFGTTMALLPHLEPGEDLRLVGSVTGGVGAVNVLLVVAAAAERALDSGAPCLALCLGDTHMRMGLLVRPPPVLDP